MFAAGASTSERPPPALLIPRPEVSARDRSLARSRRFRVRGQVVELVPPVDWRMDPVDNRSWRFWLHAMQFLDVPLRIYASDGDLDSLTVARDLLVDWIAANSVEGERTGDYAWHDMACGVRASLLGYAWRECQRHGLLDPECEERLVRSLDQHGRWLADDRNYNAANNHGLYQDAGLLLMATCARELPDAAPWRALAETRFVATLRRHLHFGEGLHKEHSPGYHMYICELVTRLHEHAGIGGDQVAALLPRLEAATAWLVLPDGMRLPFGDTDMTRAPGYATDLPAPRGLGAFLETGYAVMREDGSHLAVTCGYHTRAHKHADELSWCLYERGRLIVGEASRYGYRDEADPARVYARSSHAHNTLIVDDRSFSWHGSPPYGSGLVAAGCGAGWYAVLGENPLLPDVEHQRLFLYRPGELAIVVDRIEALEHHDVVRRVHFGPDVEVAEAPSGTVVYVEGAHVGTLVDWSEQPVEASMARGVEKPRLEGWTFPRDQVKVPTNTVALSSRHAAATLLHGVVLAPAPIPGIAAWADDGYHTVMLSGAASSTAVGIKRSGRRLLLEQRPGLPPEEASRP